MFLEPNQTPYDLRFQVFGIPVRVHPMFWLVAAILGWSETVRGFEFLLIWIACVFVSILIHELGHVWMGMLFGTRGHIVLYGFGGLAIGSNTLSVWWQRVLVSFAGPLAGFILFGLLLLGLLAYSPMHGAVFVEHLAQQFLIPLSLPLHELPHRDVPVLAVEALQALLFINLFWGLVNLLPVFPLDGGQISRDFLTRLLPRNGYRLSLGISFLVAGLLAIAAIVERITGRDIPILPGGIWMALLFGMLALQSFMLLQQPQPYDPFDPWQGQGRPWERNDYWRR